jgi:YidC/Oxa1 family membrane protein insertase
MKFDRNTMIGFVLLALLFFGLFYFNSQEQRRVAKNTEIENRNKAIKDSTENAAKAKQNINTPTPSKDTNRVIQPATPVITGYFQNATKGTEQFETLENDLVKIGFTNKGGQIKFVELKKFKDQHEKLVRLASTQYDKIDYTIKGDSGQVGNITDFYFTKSNISKTDTANVITYTLGDSTGRVITHEFVLKKDEYMIDFNIKAAKANTFFTNETVNLQWHYKAMKQESDMSYERTNSQMGYVENGEFDYFTIGRRSEVKFDKSVEWVAMRQRFFNGILVAKDNFSSGNMTWQSPNDSLTHDCNFTTPGKRNRCYNPFIGLLWTK